MPTPQTAKQQEFETRVKAYGADLAHAIFTPGQPRWLREAETTLADNGIFS